MTTHFDHPLIALVSATPAAIKPARDAFAETYPQATLWNILDDRLLQDAADRGGVTPDLSDRMARLIDHAVAEGAEGILLTCSLYGVVAHQAAERIGVPIFAPDDAAFAAALTGEYASILVLSSLDGPLEDSVQRFTTAATDAHVLVDVAGAIAEGAFDAANAGDTEALAAALRAGVEAAVARTGRPDAVLLAQYSLAPAAEALAAATGLPVLAGPQRAARALRDKLTGADE